MDHRNTALLIAPSGHQRIRLRAIEVVDTPIGKGFDHRRVAQRPEVNRVDHVAIIEVGRIEQSIAQYGERFTRRVFTDGEIAYCAGRSTSLAARFAAKEAVSKLLGVGIQHRDGVDWREIEVVSAENGDPSVVLFGKAKKRAMELGLSEIALSFSHTHEHAIAFAVGQ